MKKTAKQWKEWYGKKEFHEKYFYDGNDLGVTCTEKGTSFLLWSPYAEQVELHFYKEGNGGEPLETYRMEKKEKGVWEYKTSKNLHKTYYDFTLKIEGEIVRTADPYAKAAGANGKRSMVVDLLKTNPDGWENDKAPKEGVERIIYETHVKEFSWDLAGGFPESVRGKYEAFLCTDTSLNKDGIHPTGIAYLKRLGVTHVQLMPIYDYGSVDEMGKDDPFNWGYDPVNYNVPEGSYSSDPEHGEVRILELKSAIQSLHKQGFRVIMDVVYNHTFSLDSWFQKTAPWYFYRVHKDGTVSNGSACGNDVASEQPMCAKYILDSVLYWAEEYHIDGFRFDLMGLLDVELMNRIRKELDLLYGRGEKLVFGEPWAADDTAMENGAVGALKENMYLLDDQIGMFCDNTRDAIKGSVFELNEPGFVNGGIELEDEILSSAKAWCKEKEPVMKAPSQIITYVSSHDNQTLWDKLKETTLEETLRRKEYRLAAGIYMTCQGNLFFLSGEEFARTKDGMENSYNAPIALNRLDWTKAWKEQEMVDYYRGLIALRKQLPGLCDKTKEAVKRIREQWKKQGVVGFTVDNCLKEEEARWKTLYIVYNSRKVDVTVSLPKGEWEILADGEDSFQWQNPSTVIGEVKVAQVSILVLGKNE